MGTNLDMKLKDRFRTLIQRIMQHADVYLTSKLEPKYHIEIELT